MGREKKERKKKKKEKEREEECDELKGIRKLADIAENKVEGDGKVKGVVPDSKDYEYDRVTRMYKKKDEVVEKERVKKGLPHPEELKQPEDGEDQTCCPGTRQERTLCQGGSLQRGRDPDGRSP